MLLLVEDMLLLGVLQESLILLGSVHFLELLTLLLKTQTTTPYIRDEMVGKLHIIVIVKNIILVTISIIVFFL